MQTMKERIDEAIAKIHEEEKENIEKAVKQGAQTITSVSWIMDLFEEIREPNDADRLYACCLMAAEVGAWV